MGMNHRTAPLALRERFAVEDLRPVLAKLVTGDEIEEAVLLSTCNRVEILCDSQQVEHARMRLRSFFERELDREAGSARDPAVGAALYEYADTGAVRHLFRVASSIDSMVLGEPQTVEPAVRC
jgi:glutamyl-tRNA reductase